MKKALLFSKIQKKVELPFFALCLFFYNCKGQTLALKSQQVHISQYQKEEIKLNSILLKNENEIFVLSDFNLAQPLRFKRTNTSFHPNPIIEYFFSETDSLVRGINVEIDSLLYLPKNTDYFEKEDRLGAFDEQYNSLRKELVETFGNPQESEKMVLKTYFGSSYWSREDFWETDKFSIRFYLNFSDKSKINGVYRVRANILYKK